MPTDLTLMTSACATAESGWSVFPCEPRGKKPITTHGLKDATTDLNQVRDWWSDCPSANLGLPTGVINGLVVLDQDGAEGQAALAALHAKHGPLPPTLSARTGRDGGQHFYYAYWRDDLKNSAGKLGRGLDIRGEGGYVIAPPSVHASGPVYRWESPIQRIAEFPAWLHRLLVASPSPAPVVKRIMTADDDDVLMRRARMYVAKVKPATQGARNAQIFSLAGHLSTLVGETGECLVEAQIVMLLTGFNLLCEPPLPESEIISAVRSALKNGTPRQLKLPQSPIQRQLALRGREVAPGC
jgi:hypothetical protein